MLCAGRRALALSLSLSLCPAFHWHSRWQPAAVARQAFSAVATCSTVQQSAPACWLRPTQRTACPIDSILTDWRHYYCTRLHVTREFLPALVEHAHYWAARRLSLAWRAGVLYPSILSCVVCAIDLHHRCRLVLHQPMLLLPLEQHLCSSVYPPPASCVALVSLVCCYCSTCC